jgi:hypothetical protein
MKNICGIILSVFVWVSAAAAEELVVKPEVVWRQDGVGAYVLPASLKGAYICPEAVKAEGQITGITANWNAAGKVTLEVSADNGSHFTAAVNGVPLARGLGSGDTIKWRATPASADSRLREVRISYTDTSGIISPFGSPLLSGFKFRKQIFIDGASSDLFNYQCKVNVGRDSHAAGCDLQCAGHVRQDFADVRFTAADGRTVLPYYCEAITDGTACFWIRVPQIPAGGVFMYIYYGNAGAQNLSNPQATFDFFGDFKGNDLDQALWEARKEDDGTYKVANGQLMLDRAQVVSRDFKFKQGIIEYTARIGDGFENRLIIKSDKAAANESTTRQVAYSSLYGGAEHSIAIGDIVKVNDPKPVSVGTTYGYRLTAGEHTLKFERLDADFKQTQAQAMLEQTGGLEAGSTGMRSGIFGTRNVTYYDWFRVRAFADPEPSVDHKLDGDEEAVSLPIYSNTTVATDGKLVLSDASRDGSYTTMPLSADFACRIMVPRSTGKGFSQDISADNGNSYKQDCASGTYYYLSRKDFAAGKNIVMRTKLSAARGPLVDELRLKFFPGAMSIVAPAGGEQWSAGAPAEITWSAQEYEPAYPLKLEYSLDTGKNYKAIIASSPNSGKYLWQIPAGIISDTALVRISDANDNSVNAVSSRIFFISAVPVAAGQKVTPMLDNMEKLASELSKEVRMKEEDLAAFLAKAGTSGVVKPYDLLITITGNYSPDISINSMDYKSGDIVTIKPAGHPWSETEKNSFLIVRANLTDAAVAELLKPATIDIGEKDKFGNPVKRMIGKRKFKIDLGKFDLAQRAADRGKPAVRRFLGTQVDLGQILKEK